MPNNDLPCSKCKGQHHPMDCKMEDSELKEIEGLAKKIPNHLVIEKRLWVENIYIDIDHIDNCLNKPLDYIGAFKKMIKKIEAICKTIEEG